MMSNLHGYLLTTLICTMLLGCQTIPTDPSAALPIPDVGSFSVRASSPEQQAAIDAANRDARERLNTLVSLDSDELSLEQFIDFIRDRTGATIAVNWPELELVGVDHDSLVTVHQKRIPAYLLLEMVLEHTIYEIYDPQHGPDFAVRNGIVMISTNYELREDPETRIYDIRWLLTKPRLHASLYRNHPRAQELIARLEDHNWWSRYTVPGLEPRHHTGPDAPSGPEPIPATVELIITTVGEPDEWLDEESTLTELNGNLVVKTTQENHHAIQHLLGSLENSQDDYFRERAKAIEIFLLLEEAEAYRLKQDYPQALTKIDQALRVDPEHVEARVLKEIVRETLSR